ncbi:MAG: TonB-dependent receptor [Mucilaginibacter sp.]|uniref:TonB-dependent receptor n=1 Tax=Mucilaginibacter sp. TaxID=1882438 RepID=UPI0032646E80
MKYRNNLIRSFLLIISIALFGFFKTDDDVIQKIVIQLDKWVKASPQEKVYLHLDKPYYAIGDDIWFKAYVTTGSDHKLSTLSGVLNVELVTDKDSVKRAIKVPLTVGTGWGSIQLADSLTEGNYRIRAYTNLMRNAGDGYFFDKTIQVGNAINNSVFTKVNYTYSTEKNQQKVDAVINYAAVDGVPYDGKEVSYKVELDNKQVAKGKGITDAGGNLRLNFINSSAQSSKSGLVTTQIRLNPKSALITKILPVKSTSQKVDLQFFPESGYLVNNIASKVAFKAVGADGLGVEVKGTIVDDQNKEVEQLTTQHLGMGAFYIQPEPGRRYTAKITYPDGSSGSVQLPVAADKGFVLSINNANADDIALRLSVNPITFQENKNAEVNLVAQSGGNIVWAAKTKLETMMFAARIPRSRFPSGIVQFTLFDAKGEALNERIVCVQNPAALNVMLSTTKAVYMPREKVKLAIEAKGKTDQPVAGIFSLSVIDETKVSVDESSESTILSNILLSSDIKGYIEKPNYYFTNINDKTKADLDLLMLTQGYRRFAWKQILTDNFTPLAFETEKSLNIVGHIKTLGGKPIPNGKVMLVSNKGGVFATDTTSDAQGRFVFDNLIFTDSIKFVIQARTAKDRKNVEIELDNIPKQLVTKNKNTADVQVNINSGMLNYLQNSRKQYDDFLKYGLVARPGFLKEVSIRDKRPPVLKNSDNLNGPGNADQILTANDLTKCATLIQCLEAKMRFVGFDSQGRPISRGGIMGILIDGNFVEPDFLMYFDADAIESIEVLRSIAYITVYGPRAIYGLLVITTKRGSGTYRPQKYAPGVITYMPIGYQRVKQFYSPQYDDPKTDKRIADLRTTIYWNPNVITDKNGNTSIEFFNADSPGTYRAVIEGIDADGNIGRQVYRYKVQ